MAGTATDYGKVQVVDNGKPVGVETQAVERAQSGLEKEEENAKETPKVEKEMEKERVAVEDEEMMVGRAGVGMPVSNDGAARARSGAMAQAGR